MCMLIIILLTYIPSIEPLAIDVARKLVRLQDTYDMPQFNEKLTKALIELMVKNETATS
jgi:hypothetical protein